MFATDDDSPCLDCEIRKGVEDIFIFSPIIQCLTCDKYIAYKKILEQKGGDK